MEKIYKFKKFNIRYALMLAIFILYFFIVPLLVKLFPLGVIYLLNNEVILLVVLFLTGVIPFCIIYFRAIREKVILSSTTLNFKRGGSTIWSVPVSSISEIGEIPAAFRGPNVVGIVFNANGNYYRIPHEVEDVKQFISDLQTANPLIKYNPQEIHLESAARGIFKVLFLPWLIIALLVVGAGLLINLLFGKI